MLTLSLVMTLLFAVGTTSSVQAEQLPIIKELPDPFLFADGTRVQSKRDWPRRRGEIKKLVQQVAYGSIPPSGGRVVAEEREATHQLPIQDAGAKDADILGATETKLLLRMGPEGKVQTHLILTVPLTDSSRQRVFNESFRF